MSKNEFKGFRNQKQQVKTAEGRKISSIKWLNRHLNDPYVGLAKAKGYRSRAAFKLKDIFEKHKDLKRSKVIVDLGCAPGGWLQVLNEVCSKAIIIGVDLKSVEPVQGAQLIIGDFLEESTNNELEKLLNGNKVDLLLSDMAANSSGNKEIDHFRNVELIEAGLEFASHHLNEGGSFVAKFLRGTDENALLAKIKQYFKTIKHYKPPSSYNDSTELFLVATGFKTKLRN